MDLTLIEQIKQAREEDFRTWVDEAPDEVAVRYKGTVYTRTQLSNEIANRTKFGTLFLSRWLANIYYPYVDLKKKALSITLENLDEE